jgi:DNA mismatch endonuclease Vsr
LASKESRVRKCLLESRLKAKLPSGKFVEVLVARSRIMAAIRGKHNRTTEVALRMALIRARISGWKLHASHLVGKPDFVFERAKLVVFVHGCFWHGCIRCGHIPQTRRLFWREKIERNRERDCANVRELKKKGFHILEVWEHSLKTSAQINAVLKQITNIIQR